MKRNKYIIALLMCFFAAFSLVAQKNVKKEEMTQVSAKVVDVNGKPIVGALVLSNEGSLQTMTDSNGDFIINSKKGGTVLVEQIGYNKIALTQAQIGTMANRIVLSYALDERIDAVVNLPYQITKQSKTSGSIAVINADKELDRDTRFNIGSATGGKVAGVMGQWDVHGIGNGTVIVDGVKRDANYLNMQEVESITVLKDAMSRMLYGSDADKAVFLVTTKNGAANKKVLKVNVEQGMQQAIAYPKFLNAADYMTTYNKAAMNDGAQPYSKFSQLQIENTLNKVDPVEYPDNNFYSNEYVRNSTNFTNVYAEASGGSESAQYFMNMGLKHNAGWMNKGQNDMQDVLNLRGKVKFDVNKWLNMNAEVVAVFDLSSASNTEQIADTTKGVVTDDYWSFSSKMLPNAQTLLIPISDVINMSAVPVTSIIDGQYLLGGSSVYTRNLYGDLTRSGSVSRLNRLLQVNTGFDLNLNNITKGLTAKGLFALDFNNKYAQLIDNDYAVYDKGVADIAGFYTVTRVGDDKITNNQTLKNYRMDFNRTMTGYVAINYNRTFGDHAISAVAMSNAREYVQKGLFQSNKTFNYGGQLNYVFKNKYIIDAGILTQGSSKLATDKKFASAPSFGAAWIASNEDFLKDNAVVNYLKIRGSYGTILNDNFTLGKYNGYYIDELNYSTGPNVFYGNGTISNKSTLINSLGNSVDWQQRKELVLGFESYLLNKKTWVEASYFNSESANVVTEMKNRTPSILGGVTVFENFNTTVNNGFEVGVKHTEKFGKLVLTVGVNYMLSNSEIIKIDEPIYNLPTNKHLTKVGASSDALWGLMADGLYAPEDFDGAGKLLNSLPVPTYGVVRPGDIKYVDFNGDEVIDADDNSVLGLSSNNNQYSFDFDLKFKNWQLYVLGIGQMGGKGYTNSAYYWFKGTEAKYSEIALKAYDPLNPNPNAEYPRLSLSNGTNNYNNSTFWMYDKSYFSLSALQVAYNVKFGVKSPLKDLKIFGRGSNLLTIAKDKKIQDLNYQLSPKSRVFALGLIASF